MVAQWRVLIAEDDALYRTQLANSVNWREFDCVLVAAVADGEAAIEVLNNRLIDILITDVEMPRLDGIDLVVRARSIRPDIECLVLSNFDTFEYVKESLKHGAADYLLKFQADSGELGGVLHQITRRCAVKRGIPVGEERPSKGHDAEIHSQLVRDVLRYLLTGAADIDHARSVIEPAMPFLTCARLGVVCFRLARYKDLMAALPERTPQARYVATLLNLIEQAVSVDAIATMIDKNLFALVVAGDSAYGFAAGSARTAMIISEMQQVVRRFFDTTVDAEAAFALRGIADLPAAWSEAHARLSRSLFDSPGAHQITSADGDLSDSVVGFTEERRLVAAILADDSVEVGAVISEVLAGPQGIPIARSSLLILASELMSVGIRVCRNRSLPLSAFLPSEESPTEVIADIGSRDELVEYVTSALVKLSSHFGGTSNTLVQRALALVRSRFREQLSLEDVAEAVGVTPSHLSRTFKAEVGHGFADELNRCRIEEAKTLLGDPRLEVKQIARQCGYLNYTYFFGVFKRYCGCTPSEFRARG